MRSLCFLVIIFASVLFESVACSALLISDGKQQLITFEEDILDVFISNRGNESNYNVAEPDSYGCNVKNINRGSTALSDTYCNENGEKRGNATRFLLPDRNQNRDSDDNNIGYNYMGLGADALGNQAYRLSRGLEKGVYGGNSLYLRIQNDTGMTVTDWKFATDIFFGEDDADRFSVLRFSDVFPDSGSKIYIDNISITAIVRLVVPDPNTLSRVNYSSPSYAHFR